MRRSTSQALSERCPRRSALMQKQSGVGLIEVMVALAIVVFVAVVSANIQVTALLGTRSSELHFALDRLSGEMLETLRAHAVRAGAGEFDRDEATAAEGSDGGGDTGGSDGTNGSSDDDGNSDDEPDQDDALDDLSTEWHQRVAEAIHGAGTKIDCDEGFCAIEITWSEEIDGTLRRQRFRSGTPL